MELLSVPQLRNNQLQSLAEGSIGICSDIPELKLPLAQVKKNLKVFIDGMLKVNASAEQKRLIDNNRDELTKGITRQIKTETYYPHTKTEAIDIVKRLERINKKYGYSIARLSYSEQTVATDNLLTDLKQINFDDIPDSSIPRWIPLLEKANNEFKIAAGDYIADTAKGLDIASATTIAPALSESLEALFAMLYAYGKISASPAIVKASTELEILMASFR